MVLYFFSNVVEPPAKLYMGRDKEENEELIRWGWPEDVWFHVDKLSSAHVYLRLEEGQSIEQIPEEVIADACQLVKANSIEGNKKNNLDVVYTMWSNLKKTGDMAVGQVGFHNDKGVKKVRVEKKINEIVNRLNKTRVEKELGREVDLQAEREERDTKERQKQKEEQRIRRQQEQNERIEREKAKEARSYDKVFVSEKMKSNKDDGNISDDFM